MTVAPFLQGFLATFITFVSAQFSPEAHARGLTQRTSAGGIHIPILRSENANIFRRASGTAVGLGDLYDMYVFRFEIGATSDHFEAHIQHL